MPVLDRLTADGTVFENAFSNGPYTRVSIPSFHTSRYLAYGESNAFPTIASILDSHGVHTAAIGTQTGIDMVQGEFGFEEMIDLGRDDFAETADRSPVERTLIRIDGVAASVSEWLQRRRMNYLYELLRRPYNAVVGSDDIVMFKGYNSAETVTDRAISWLQDRDDSNFFLWLHYMEAHRPYGIHDDRPAYLDGPVDENTIQELMKTAGTAPEEISDSQRRLMIDLYDSDLRYCSHHLSRLFDVLEAENLWERTNLLFSSDHGEEFGEHDLFFHRNYPYDELIHVPLIVKPADETPGHRVAGQRELLDIAPTICSFYGIEPAEYSFLGTHLYEGDGRNVIVLGQPGMEIPAVSIRTEEWKYIHTNDEAQLYDLPEDPGEQTNVVEQNPQVAARLRRMIPERLFDRDTKTPRPPKDEVDREQLDALGYVELRDEDT